MLTKVIILLSSGLLILFFLLLSVFLSVPAMNLIFLSLVIVILNLIWYILPTSTQRAFSASRKRFLFVLIPCILFFSYGSLILNFYLLPGVFHPWSLLIDGMMLVITILLGRGLLKGKLRLVLPAGLVLVFLLTSLLGFFRLVIPGKGTRSHTLQGLKSLPYLTMVPAGDSIDKKNVTRCNSTAAFPGLRLYAPRSTARADLVDLNGNVVHRWAAKVDENDTWMHVEADGSGDILAIVQGRRLVKVGFDSGIQWTREMQCHHDIAIAANGNIYTLINEDEIAFYHSLPLPILNNYIVVLSPQGDFIKRFSFFRILLEVLPPDLTARAFKWWNKGRFLPRSIFNTLLKLINAYGFNYYDLFHVNTLEIIQKNVDGLCRRGDILFCSRSLDMIGIIDGEKWNLKWSWGPGILDRPHAPSLLDNGRILIFDNGPHRGYSRLLEMDPLSGKITWEYKSAPPERFFTEWRGFAQRLPNGNTLITESDTGRVFEITPDKKIVWEFYCAEIDPKDQERSAIYRMTSLWDLNLYPFLGTLQEAK